MHRARVAPLLLCLAGCGGANVAAPGGQVASAVECAPFARQVTGINLYGDAASWWDQADGRYRRQSAPAEGGVLVLRRTDRLPHGHVSVVTRQVSDRVITVVQANWVHHRITRDDKVVDVSQANDWSRVRVWWAPSQAIGTTVYPAYGFIAPVGSPPQVDASMGAPAP